MRQSTGRKFKPKTETIITVAMICIVRSDCDDTLFKRVVIVAAGVPAQTQTYCRKSERLSFRYLYVPADTSVTGSRSLRIMESCSAYVSDIRRDVLFAIHSRSRDRSFATSQVIVYNGHRARVTVQNVKSSVSFAFLLPLYNGNVHKSF